MKKLLQDITTGTDNETHEIVRTSMAIIVGMLPFVMLWGIIMQTWAFFTGKTFDLMGSFQAVLAFLAGAGAFILQGGIALFFKNKTTPDGTQTETSSITTSSTTQKV